MHEESSFLFLWSSQYPPITVGETEAQKVVDPQLAVTASGLLDLSTGLSHTALLKDAETRGSGPGPERLDNYLFVKNKNDIWDNT